MSELTPIRASPAHDSEFALPARQQAIRPGDIRRIEPIVGLEAQSRDALIVRTDRHRHDYSEIMLTHTRVDMATPDDAIVYPRDPAYHQGLVVQTHHRGMVWNLQVTTLLSQLTTDVMAEISSVTQPQNLSRRDASTGKPFAEGYDTRSGFQESELQALWALTGDCTDAMLDDGPHWHIDGGLLSPRLLAQLLRPEQLLTDVMHILRTREVTATPETLHWLQTSGSFDAESWKVGNYGPGLASQIALSIRSLIERGLREHEIVENYDGDSSSSIRVPKRVNDAGDIHMRPGDRLVTAPFLWLDGGDFLLARSDHGRRDGIDGLEVMMLATTDDRKNSEETAHGV